ncbi:MAG: hypothetical protein WC725_01795 [Patescibacteria group bacterium]|jgi:hypothetical protein
MGLGINIDFSFWQWFFELPPTTAAAVVFALGGWVFISAYLLKSAVDLWVGYRAGKYTAHWKYAVLAVDVPPLFVQTPKAVEQIFAHLTGSLIHSNIEDKFIVGRKQKNFSIEIISIEGYIQFLIRTEVEFRDLVEASIYAQYPEAEITEVEDYVINLPDKFPDENYDVMGVEYKLAKADAYPIRTYPEFEYSLSKDAVFSDPMAAILENFTRLGHGENLWAQIILEPVDSSWKEKAIALAKELMTGGGGHGHGGGNPVLNFINGFLTQLGKDVHSALITWEFDVAHGDDHAKDEKVVLEPGTKKAVEAIEDKLSKIGFKTKLRVLYGARKEVFNPSHCLDGFTGAMNQFHMQNHNAIVPAGATHAHYDSSHVKSNVMKTSFMKAYRDRKMKWGKTDGYVLNIEELATLWHFPLPFVKTPLLHKAGAKRSEPPSGLPVEMMENPLKPIGFGEKKQHEEEVKPPEEIMYG